jgi:tetratricopeptide (TPR) repeat protein
LVTEIEKTAHQIEEACDKFFTMRARMDDLIEKGKTLDAKLSEASEKLSNSLKELRAKSEAIEEAWRLNAHEFEEGNVDRGAYEKRLRQLTEEMSDIGFSYRARVCLDMNTIERQLDLVLKQIGVPSNLSTAGGEVTIKATEEQKKQIDEIHQIVEETKEQLKGTPMEESSGDPESYRRFGVFYAQGKNWKMAEDCFSKAVKLNIKDSLAWRGLGYIYCIQANYTQAIASYKTALDISPVDGILWYNLGTAYSLTRRFTEAISCYKQALQLLPKFAPIWCNLGITYSDIGDYREAINSYIKAIELKPEFGVAWFNLAFVYRSVGLVENARICSEKAKSYGYS